MPDKLATYKLPDEFVCPVCEAILIGASPVTGGPPRGFHKGHLSVCAYCGSILVLGDSMFHQITKDEFEKLPKATQQNLKLITGQIIKRIKENPEIPEDN